MTANANQLAEEPASVSTGFPVTVGWTHAAMAVYSVLRLNTAVNLKMIIEMHKKATDYAMAHPEEMIEVAMQKLGQQRKSIEIAVPNVELTWKLGSTEIEEGKIYADHMLALKQIKRVPDFSTFFDTSFVDAVKPT